MIFSNEKVKVLYRQNLANDIASHYLAKRDITKETISFFELGFASGNIRYLESNLSALSDEQHDQKSVYQALTGAGLLAKSEKTGDYYNRFRGRLIFPIHNIKNECIGFGGRILSEDTSAAKYINSPESIIFHKQNNLYNLNNAKEAIRKEEQAILVEGYFDVIGLHQKDIKNTVAPLGTSFTENQARLLKRYTENLIIFFDSDKAGIEAAYKAFLTASHARLNCRVVILETNEKKDPFDIAKNSDKIDLLATLDSAKDEISFILWYFFSFRYNVSIFNQKKEAIESFFEFLKSLPDNWQKDEYLKNAASAIAGDYESLKKDFTLFQKKGTAQIRKLNEKEDEKVIKKTRVLTIEKEILSLLLRFPELWEQTNILSEIEWVNENIYLLFSFFRDRIKTGEVWSFENINKAITLLSGELSSALSGIIIEFEESLEELSIMKDEQNNNFLVKIFEKLMLRHKETTISKSIHDMKEKLSFEESTGSQKTEDITNELGCLLEEKKKIAEMLKKT